MKISDKLNLDDVLEAAIDDSDSGFCIACGAERDGCEPDARQYPCEVCGEHQVYGASEIIIMVGA